MIDVKRKNVEIVYQQGGTWIWSHKPDNRGLSDQEALPYYVTTRDQVRMVIRNRYAARGLDPMSVRITWA